MTNRISRRGSLAAITAVCAAPIAMLSAENGGTAPLRLTAREERVIRGFRRVTDEDGRELVEIAIAAFSPERAAERKARYGDRDARKAVQ